MVDKALVLRVAGDQITAQITQFHTDVSQGQRMSSSSTNLHMFGLFHRQWVESDQCPLNQLGLMLFYLKTH